MPFRPLTLLAAALLPACTHGSLPFLSPGAVNQAADLSPSVPDVAVQRADPERALNAVYAAFLKARDKKDADSAFACMTKEYQNHLLCHWIADVIIYHGEKAAEKYMDKERLEALTEMERNRISDEPREYPTVAALKNKRDFFRANAAMQVKKEHELGILREPLRDVSIRGERARGVVTRRDIAYYCAGDERWSNLESRDHPLHFAWTNTGWKLDLPTPEEQQEDEAAEHADSLEKLSKAKPK